MKILLHRMMYVFIANDPIASILNSKELIINLSVKHNSLTPTQKYNYVNNYCWFSAVCE